MINSTYNPSNQGEFEKSKLTKNAQGVQVSCPAGQTTTLDLAIADDHLLIGAIFLAKGAAAGDKVQFQVLAGGNVVAQFITNWFVDPDSTFQHVPQSSFPAKVFTGLTLRISYESVGETDVWIAVNYDLLKVLI